MRGNAHPSKLAPAKNIALLQAIDHLATIITRKASIARPRVSITWRNHLIAQLRKPPGHQFGQIARVIFNLLGTNLQNHAQRVIQMHNHLHSRIPWLELFRHRLFGNFGIALGGLFGPHLEIVPAKTRRSHLLFYPFAQITRCCAVRCQKPFVTAAHRQIGQLRWHAQDPRRMRGINGE